MKTFTLNTIYQGEDCTLGKMFDENMSFDTIERPWLNNQHGISCIPEGTYLCTYHNGFKQKDCWELQGVHDRTGICIHSANIASELEGCIALGSSSGRLHDQRAVFHSVDALNALKQYIGRDYNGELKQFYITIIREA